MKRVAILGSTGSVGESALDVIRSSKGALEATVLNGSDHLEKEITTCGASDLMSDILAGLSEGCILLTGLTTVQVIRTAMVAGVGAVSAGLI